MVLLSDHGFERLDTDININYLLREQGLLQFTKDSEISLGNICPETKAFALDPSRIYLNLKDKFPCGSVEQNQAEQVLSEIEDLFYSLEVDGKKAIKKIYRKEQIFSGR